VPKTRLFCPRVPVSEIMTQTPPKWDGALAPSGSGTERIVFVRRGGVGDFIVSLPLLRALSSRQTWICLVTRRAYLALLPPECRCDAFIDSDSAAAVQLYAPEDVSHAVTPSLAALCSGASLYLFARHDPDWAIALQAFRPGKISWLDPHPTSPPHVAERFLLAGGVTAGENALLAPLWPKEDAGRHLWLHPGSGSPRKNAPVDVFADFAERWKRSNDGDVLASFGEADQDLVSRFADAMEQRRIPHRCVQPEDLGALRDQLARKAKLYVGNDSGVSHLAGALGVPVVAIFRSTDPRIWHPLGPRVTVVTSTSIESIPV